MAYDTNEPQTTSVAQMVECEITMSGVTPAEVSDLETAREAVDTLMGEGRQLEMGGLGNWLVEFRPGEIEVLDLQGYIELSKGRFTLTAEMP